MRYCYKGCHSHVISHLVISIIGHIAIGGLIDGNPSKSVKSGANGWTPISSRTLL